MFRHSPHPRRVRSKEQASLLCLVEFVGAADEPQVEEASIENDASKRAPVQYVAFLNHAVDDVAYRFFSSWCALFFGDHVGMTHSRAWDFFHKCKCNVRKKDDPERRDQPWSFLIGIGLLRLAHARNL
ncbi:MAG: hypothetical protein R8G34_07745 [Paracoccaceae bacterium]|nr:hypothetical protein [Paracoccaceae bacterium]